MSREFKVCNLHQAVADINTVSERLTAARSQLQQRIENARREAEEAARREAKKESARAKAELERQLSTSIRGVNEQIRQLDDAQRRHLQKTAQAIYESIDLQAAQLHSEIQSAQTGLRKDIQSLEERTKKSIDAINRHISQLEKSIDSRFADQQHQIDRNTRQLSALTSTVNDILDRFADEQAKRKEAVAMVRAIYDASFSRADIARFCPTEARRIERRLANLLANPNTEATVAQATETIMEIQLAEEDAITRKAIYDAVRSQALEALSTVLQEVNQNRSTSIKNPEDESDTISLETDFWSRGEYTMIQKRLEELKQELDSEPSIDRIKEIMNETAKAEVDASKMVEDAARLAILSENRINITEDIVTALIQQGWQVEQNPDGTDSVNYLGGEMNNDWREGVFAVMRSVKGETITIVIRPDDNERENQIIFHRNDSRPITDREFIQRLQEIKRQIERSGHKLGDIIIPEGGGDEKIPEMTDGARLGHRGSAGTINKRVRIKK